MIYRRGRKPAVFTRRSVLTASLMSPIFNALGAPPEACNDYIGKVKVICPMYLNNRLGDCVPADTAHTLIIRSSNVGAGTAVVATDADVVKLYSAVGGYVPGNDATDNGCVEEDMESYLRATGFLGHKADATASIDPTRQDYLKWGNQLFGHVRLGWNLPDYAEDQFEAREPWDVQTTGPQGISGHDTPLVDYRGGMFYVCTWGRWRQPVTPAFMAKYLEEAHAELFYDWIAAQGVAPSGFSLQALAEKLQAIGENEGGRF